MTREQLQADVRHYRRQHRECIAARNWWIRLMDGRKTGAALVHEHHAALCRKFAREKINAIRSVRNVH